MTTRRLFQVGGVLVAIAIGWVGARYLRHPGRLSGSREPASKLTLRFFSNPADVPAFTAHDLEGRTVSSNTLRGQVILVNFWATWCPPCRAEIPDLIELQNKYRGQLQVVGISQDETGADDVKRFVAAQRINYPVVMSTPELERIFSGVYALPTSFIVDRDLKIVQKHVGMLNSETTEAEVRALSGLAVDAVVERVEGGDETKQMIKDAAQATKIPGLDLDKLSPTVRAAALKQLNADPCTCGCKLTLAACRINDPTCSVSLPLARKIVESDVRP